MSTSHGCIRIIKKSFSLLENKNALKMAKFLNNSFGEESLIETGVLKLIVVFKSKVFCFG